MNNKEATESFQTFLGLQKAIATLYKILKS